MTDDLLPRDRAVERLLSLRDDALAAHGTDTVGPDAVAGRVLADPVVAPDAVPPHDYATMDGVACDAADDYPLAIVGDEVTPDDDPPELGRGEAVRIATGAPLPDRATVVVKREDTTVEDGELAGPDLAPGTHVYERGSTVAAGETVFQAGERLSPKDAVLLDDLGVGSVRVRERASVGVVATGTEIHEGSQPDRDSNMLLGLARSWGHDAVHAGTAPDDADAVRALLAEAAEAHDVVVSTGGTSVGHGDHVVDALAALGGLVVHGVALRPGKPVTVAHLPEHDAVAVALPGKPVAAHTAACLVARPLFTASRSLPTVAATATVDLDVPETDTTGGTAVEYAVPVALDDGRTTPLGHPDSGHVIYGRTFDPSVLASSTHATRADGLVLTRDGFTADETVAVVPYGAVE
ncbi:molybdopterin molybdotransferase MoeA [Haloarchaeobius iranensis]|uniref:Molybdopterin molybdotransferase n=1 Tax=Haloarchaeobius iranensis TaxID=996166 RepID=A0A1G9UY68_9EURY|nr:molybdopterin molybdotransferase MoeA [Haloarchaeobius iranensis]SDM64803.1 molybdopterin molybdotransferase [Haloarchaeobius iranensis]